LEWVEQRRVFLVSDGISPQEAREFGFECGTSNFDEALAWAMDARGTDARIAVTESLLSPTHRGEYALAGGVNWGITVARRHQFAS
jgi:hypothetical protein